MTKILTLESDYLKFQEMGEVSKNSSFKYGLYTLSANQTSNLAIGKHIEWDTVQGSLDNLSTGGGQENGIITLPAGTYKISGSFLIGHTSGGKTLLELYDKTNQESFGIGTISSAMNYDSNYSSQPNIMGIITSETEIEIAVRFDNVVKTNLVYYGKSYLLIEEYGGY